MKVIAEVFEVIFLSFDSILQDIKNKISLINFLNLLFCHLNSLAYWSQTNRFPAPFTLSSKTPKVS